MAESRGGLVGLAAAGGVATLVVIGVVIWLVRGCSGDGPASTAAARSQGADLAREGMHARGTDELRQIGCATAIVMDMARALGDAGVREGEPRMLVTCDVATTDPPPSCERAAATYFSALGGTADGNVNVRVSRQGVATPVCSKLYLPSGADLGAYPRVQ
jgi:hypothetical protein